MKLNFDEVGNGPKPKKRTSVRKKTKDVTVSNPLDLALAKKSLSVYDKKIDELAREMDRFSVTSEVGVMSCTDVVSKVSALKKTMETNRKNTIKDADFYVRSVNRFCKIYRDKVDGIIKAGKAKIGNYQFIKEQKRREAEAEARKAKDSLQADLDKKAAAGGYEPVQMPDPVVPETTGPVRTESGSSSTLMVWDWEITNQIEVPVRFLSVDSKKVDQAIKAGIRDIPGINIFQKPQVRIITA